MGIRHGSVHAEHGRIERAQAHGTRSVLKCEVRLTSPNSQPGTKDPACARLGLTASSPIHESRGVVELMGYKGECISTHTQRYWVVRPQMHRFPSQPHSFGTLLHLLDHPATRFRRT